MKIRRYQKIQATLLDRSAPEGFKPIPVYTNKAPYQDEISCHVAKVKSSRLGRMDSTYVHYLNYIPQLLPKFEKLYGNKLSKNMTFAELMYYEDLYIAQNFEGIIDKDHKVMGPKEVHLMYEI